MQLAACGHSSMHFSNAVFLRQQALHVSGCLSAPSTLLGVTRHLCCMDEQSSCKQVPSSAVREIYAVARR